MTYLINKLLHQFPKSQEKICTIQNIMANYPFLLIQHNLKPEDLIIVWHTKRVKVKYGWKNYRTKWKLIYKGSLEGFIDFSRKFMERKVWSKNRKVKE